MPMCKECQARFSTHPSRLCRFCLRTKEQTEIVAAAVLAYKQLDEPEPDPPREPIRTAVYEGEAFDVMWDGVVREEATS